MFDRRKPSPSSSSTFVTHENIEAKIKWFDPEKGFGFASPADGSGDVFVHVSALGSLNPQELQPGATIIADLGEGRRGLQVVAVHEVDPSTATPAAPSGRFGGGGGDRDRGAPRSFAPRPSGPRDDYGGGGAVEGPYDGQIKFFNVDRGFGFIAPDRGGPDVFLHVSSLTRSGLSTPVDGQRVRFSIRSGKKGPEAANVSFL